MDVHKLDFIVPYKELIKEFEASEEFQKLDADFEVVTKEYGKGVAYKTLVDLTEDDNVIYAKRKGRYIYTKFVDGKDVKNEVSRVTFVLKRNNINNKQYFLITMYPGEQSKKEPEDKNIKSLNELMECIGFWRKKALILREEDIEMDTIMKDCPYDGYLINRALELWEEQ